MRIVRTHRERDMDQGSPTSRLDIAERLVKLTREIVLIVIALGVAVVVMPFVPQLLEQAKGLQLTSAEVAGLRFERAKEVEEKLETVQRALAPTEGNKDQRPTKEARLIAEALDKVRAVTEQSAVPPSPAIVTQQKSVPAAPAVPVSFWVYIGAIRDGRWESKNFDVTGPVNVGDTIRAGTDVYRRKSAPRKENGDWKMGDPLGQILQEGKAAVVQEITEVPGLEGKALIWARVASNS